MSAITYRRAKGAADTVLDKLCRVQVGLDLIEEIDDGKIRDLNGCDGMYTYRALGFEIVRNAYKDIFEIFEEVQGYIEQKVVEEGQS